ncbi:uncharacterized protein BO80DRAFT_470870 [Aspergillus ibericus CBS 121593]|uniref:Uncharacterized protein n=1 Tax=Aspergillus ibericus CBS 121593 TaxID=1448316 RepID=A0A395H6L1_9EURO|nr:hypothetical protein BO80DRAFT_470870 [Aspergillus ibericus CBS 121593]RAL03189.1 hypothetical protein BO80DRAFT_470870 [Aspergillus ibericus CBS 121593]
MTDNQTLPIRIATFKRCEQLLDFINAVRLYRLGIDDLRHIGIRATRVELKDNQTLSFDPVYFKPLEVGVLAKYPFSPCWREYDLDEGYSYKSILARILHVTPEASNPQKLAQKKYEEVQKHERQYGSHRLPPWAVRDLENHIHSHQRGYRSGIPGIGRMGTLEDLTPLYRNENAFENVPLSSRLMETDEPGATNWRFLYALEEPFGTLPHTIAFFWNFERADDETLTTSEVRGVLRWTVWMYHRYMFRNHSMFPCLSIWYLGPKHVRIIQSHFDGETIVLQYSPLLSFENRNTAPTELVVRYAASRPLTYGYYMQIKGTKGTGSSLEVISVSTLSLSPFISDEIERRWFVDQAQEYTPGSNI